MCKYGDEFIVFAFKRVVAGLGYYRVDSLLSALDKLLMILILGYLAFISSYSQQFHIKMLIYGQGLAYLLACVIAGVFVQEDFLYFYSFKV